MSLKIALLGANGFIGTRVVEIFHLTGIAEVRPIVRSAASLARLSRFNMDSRIADAFDRSALQDAFRGCDVVLHSIAGDAHSILGTLNSTYQAAQQAGVRRLVYLGTASVHGQAPIPGTNERTPLSDRQPISYNNLKVRAERKLRRLRETGDVELVILRPGIVFGPRSSWISNFAADLLAGKAALIDRGRGICNSIYVDNLVHAIYLAATTPNIDGEAFLVGDQELVTWSDLYQPIAEALGFDLEKIPEAEIPDFKPDWRDTIKDLHTSKPVQAFLSFFPKKLRYAAFSALVSWLEPSPPSPWELPVQWRPVATQEMALLYQCKYKFPFEKAKKMLGYEPVVSFPEACRRSIAWLAFAGYPVLDHQFIGHVRESGV